MTPSTYKAVEELFKRKGLKVDDYAEFYEEYDEEDYNRKWE